MTHHTLDRTPMRERLFEVGHAVLRRTTSDIARVQVKHLSHAVTRLSNNRVLTSDNGERFEIFFEATTGGRVPISMMFNQIDGASINAVVKMLDALARVQFGASVDPLHVPDGPQTYIPVHLWHDTTHAAMATVGDTVVPLLVQRLANANVRGSGFVGLLARSTLVMQNDGLEAFVQETDAECSVSARTSSGDASGWYGQAARDWSQIHPEEIARRAIESCRRGAGPSAVEPGRRTVILTPWAFAQILRQVSKHFDAYATNIYQTTAFARPGDPIKRNKIGMRVFDRRIRVTSDPADPDGGYTPFGDNGWDGIALPTRAIHYVEGGILQDLSYNIPYGLSEGKPFTQAPWSLRVEAEGGTPLQTLDEMVAGCDDGIYINRFSNIHQLDSVTGMQTGVTRDGCFLIRQGKIDRPVKNFRFTDSPFFFLNNLLAIGKSERVALGYVAPTSGEPSYVSEWPRRPMIVPPVMIRDFNLSGLSDAI
jgi:predicted Zn-dependent protease